VSLVDLNVLLRLTHIVLNESKEKAREELRELSKLYTEPSNDPSEPKLHAYSLRGVSTNKSTMYICRRAEPDLIDMDLDGDSNKVKGDQWWRIHYAPIGSSPVTVEVSRSRAYNMTVILTLSRKPPKIRLLRRPKTRLEAPSSCMRMSTRWICKLWFYQSL
jgi:hypothetical protein